VLTRGGICVPPKVTYLPYRVSASTLTTVGRSRLLVRWPGTHCRILSGIQRAAQTVFCIYLKRTSSRDTNASSALGVLNNYHHHQFHVADEGRRVVAPPCPRSTAIMRYTNPRNHSLTHSSRLICQLVPWNTAIALDPVLYQCCCQSR